MLQRAVLREERTRAAEEEAAVEDNAARVEEKEDKGVSLVQNSRQILGW